MQTIPITEFIIRGLKPQLNLLPGFIRYATLTLLRFLLLEKRINALTDSLAHFRGHNFNEQLLEELGVGFSLSNKSLQNIPAEGRLLIAANHPLGGLDGLLLLKAIALVRQDVKVLANDVLMSIDNLSDVFIPADILGGKRMRIGVESVMKALSDEEAVIIFPAGEVSRFGVKGIKDNKWKKGILFFSRTSNTPVLPVYISGRNSLLFYILSFLWKPLSFLRLVHELFNKKGKNFSITIGSVIPAAAFNSSGITDKHLVQRLKKHCYLIGKEKPGLFKSESTVASPEGRALLWKELTGSEKLVELGNKTVYKVTGKNSPITLREIARLREITFRKVGEGTGKRRDFDKYDFIYDHIVLWDNQLLEIAGSYRIGNGKMLLQTNEPELFYSSTLFNFSQRFNSMLPCSLELGRSFIQEKFHRSNALDLLWKGIAAYINRSSDVRYLFGPVSISGIFPERMKQMMVYYFERWYKPTEPFASAHLPPVIPGFVKAGFNELFAGNSAEEDFKILKKQMKAAGYTLPVLFRQYIDLCDEGGVSFSAFNIDPLFNNCIDGFIVLDLKFLKQSKKERYFLPEESGILTVA